MEKGAVCGATQPNHLMVMLAHYSVKHYHTIIQYLMVTKAWHASRSRTMFASSHDMKLPGHDPWHIRVSNNLNDLCRVYSDLRFTFITAVGQQQQ